MSNKNLIFVLFTIFCLGSSSAMAGCDTCMASRQIAANSLMTTSAGKVLGSSVAVIPQVGTSLFTPITSLGLNLGTTITKNTLDLLGAIDSSGKAASSAIEANTIGDGRLSDFTNLTINTMFQEWLVVDNISENIEEYGDLTKSGFRDYIIPDAVFVADVVTNVYDLRSGAAHSAMKRFSSAEAVSMETQYAAYLADFPEPTDLSKYLGLEPMKIGPFLAESNFLASSLMGNPNQAVNSDNQSSGVRVEFDSRSKALEQQSNYVSVVRGMAYYSDTSSTGDGCDMCTRGLASWTRGLVGGRLTISKKMYEVKTSTTAGLQRQSVIGLAVNNEVLRQEVEAHGDRISALAISLAARMRSR